MNSNELRLGNWVIFTPNPHYTKVEEIHIDCIVTDDCYVNYDEIEPIPLSPEILEKCGFVKKHYGFEFESFIWWNDRGLSWEMWNGIDFPHIKHLHQLQNLYFALTGTELNIEL